MPEWLREVAPILGAAVGVYAAIRSDLAYLRARVEGLSEDVRHAHKRIDSMPSRR